jgi:hypothetical protein
MINKRSSENSRTEKGRSHERPPWWTFWPLTRTRVRSSQRFKIGLRRWPGTRRAPHRRANAETSERGPRPQSGLRSGHLLSGRPRLAGRRAVCQDTHFVLTCRSSSGNPPGGAEEMTGPTHLTPPVRRPPTRTAAPLHLRGGSCLPLLLIAGAESRDHSQAPSTRFASLKLPSATRRETSCHSRVTFCLPSGCDGQFVRVIGEPE